MKDDRAVKEAGRWLRFAREDLGGAAAILKDDSTAARNACWLAQQAAEKAIKAGLVFLQVRFAKTHDLDALRDLLPDDWRAKQTFADLSELAEWSVEARYPGLQEEPTREDAAAAMATARTVVDLMGQDISSRSAD
jgi:HEPN domain-containing protein